MTTHSVRFEAEVEMVGNDPRPALLTTLVRPNFVFGDDSYCLCYITETKPADGIGPHEKGSFKATAVCADDVARRFSPDVGFDLRAATRLFAKGKILKVYSRHPEVTSTMDPASQPNRDDFGAMPPFSLEKYEMDRDPDESDEDYAARRALFE
jgi:hypothetical protein